MGADLVGTARMEPQPHKGKARPAPQRLVIRPGALAPFIHNALFPLPAKRQLHAAAAGIALAERQILPAKVLRMEAAAQYILCVSVFGQKNKPTCPPIQPMHRVEGQLRTVKGQGIGQGAKSSLHAMHRHIRGLIDKEQVLVLIDDGQRRFHGRGTVPLGGVVQPHSEPLPGSQRIRSPGRRAVYAQRPLPPCETADLSRRHAQSPPQQLLHAKPGLPFFNCVFPNSHGSIIAPAP